MPLSANRMHYRDTVHFITNCCEHEMFFLLPTVRIAQIIQCWFARALCLYGQWRKTTTEEPAKTSRPSVLQTF
jgi:hypothetical protein